MEVYNLVLGQALLTQLHTIRPTQLSRDLFYLKAISTPGEHTARLPFSAYTDYSNTQAKVGSKEEGSRRLLPPPGPWTNFFFLSIMNDSCLTLMVSMVCHLSDVEIRYWTHRSSRSCSMHSTHLECTPTSLARSVVRGGQSYTPPQMAEDSHFTH